MARGVAKPAAPAVDMVNSPPHYNAGDIECIDAIQAQMTTEEFVGFLRGQVAKYNWRLGHKVNAQQDAEKAAWYLAKLIEVLGAE